MSSQFASIGVRAEALNKIRQKMSDRVKNTKLDTRDEEVAYLLGVIDTLTKGMEWRVN